MNNGRFGDDHNGNYSQNNEFNNQNQSENWDNPTGFGNNNGMMNSKLDSDIQLLFILGIIQVLMVCCCNFMTFIAGIVTLVLVSKAKSIHGYGNQQQASNMVTKAKIANVVGWILLVLNTIINLVAGVFRVVFDKL